MEEKILFLKELQEILEKKIKFSSAFETDYEIVTEDCDVEIKGEGTIHFKKGEELNMDSTGDDFLCPEESRVPIFDLNKINNYLIRYHDLHVCVNVNASGWFWEITRVGTGSTVKTSEYSGPNDGGCWNTKDDALMDGIVYCLKLI